MNLPMRQNKKRNQALDAFASLAKTWSEWRLGERAAQSVTKGAKKASKSTAKARKRAAKAAKHADASSVKNAMKGTPLKVAGAVAIVGAVGAAVAKKLKGGGTAEPLYTPPSAPAPMPPPAELKDIPAPPATSVVVGDLAPDEDSEPEPAPADDAADEAGDAPVEDAELDAVLDAGAATTDPGVSADADAGELEPAPADDGHDDDAPAAPSDDAGKS